ncbi:hypothetical protein AAG906_009084 [Vitis piasezkii]
MPGEEALGDMGSILLGWVFPMAKSKFGLVWTRAGIEFDWLGQGPLKDLPIP